MKNKWIAILAIMLILSGCKQTPVEENPSEPDEPTVVEPVEEEPEPIVEEPVESLIIEEFSELLTGESNAADLGNFITIHISEVNPEEAEMMIEWLVIYQTELIHMMNGQIYQNSYMDVLNNDLGGVLDPTKIDQIADEQIREEFQDLIDAYLTIVRYEETPSVETDWHDISSLSPFFSEDFKAMTILNDKIQNFDYNRRDPDFIALAEDAIAVESLINAHERSFLTWQLELLYQNQIGNLLVGPEGSYIGTFEEKDGKLYDDLIDISERYSESELGQLIVALDKEGLDVFDDILEMINAYKQFGFKVDYTLEREVLEIEEARIDRINIRMPGEKEREAIINETLLNQANGLILAAGVEGEYSVYMHPIFENDIYLTVIMSISYTDPEKGYGYEDQYVNIDLTNGEMITLEDYFRMPYQEFEEELKILTGVDFEAMPEFGLNNLGISLSAKRVGQVREDYAFLTLKDLLPFVPYQDQYK
jgi:hypothetical protein